MKKIISLILSVVLIFSANVFSVCANEVRNDTVSEYIELFKALGVFSEDDTPSLSANVSRGEFTDYLLKLVNAYENLSTSEQSFWDVTEENPYFTAASTAKSLGVVNGNGDGSFAPYTYITPVQATAMVLNLMGYSDLVAVKGDFISAVYDVARSVDIYTVLSIGGEYLTVENMLKLFNDAIRSGVYDVTMFTSPGTITFSQSDETILERDRDIFLFRGVNTLVRRIDEEKGTRDILVDGNLIRGVPAEFDYCFGYTVDCWAKEVNDSTYDFVYMIKTHKNSSVKIEFGDIGDIDSEQVVYYENDRIRTLDLDISTKYIYNGEEVDFSKHTFDDLFVKECGEIEFIDNDDDNVYEYAVINAYDTVVLQHADLENELIYDALSPVNKIDLDEYDLYEIYDTQGKITTTPEIGSVISVLKGLDKEYIKLICSDKVITGNIDSTDADGNYTINGTEYKLTEELATHADSSLLKAGTQATFSLDIHNRIAYIKPDITAVKNIAFLVYVAEEDGLSEKVYLRFFGTDAEYHTADVAKRVKIDGKTYKHTSDILDALGASGTFTPIPVAYKVNEEGEVNYIDTPLKKTGVEDDYTLVRRYSSSQGNMYFKGSTNANYELSFGGKYLSRKGEYYSFMVNDETLDWRDMILYPNLVDDTSYKMDIYSFSEDSPFAEIVLVYGKAADKVDNTVYLYSGSSMALDEDDEVVQKIKCYKGETEETLIVASGYDSAVTGANVISENAKTNLTQEQIDACGGLNPGDLFRVGKNHKGRVILCEKVYDYENQLFINPTKNSTLTNQSHEFSTNAKVGFLLGDVYSYTNGYTRFGINGIDLSTDLDSQLETVYGTGIMYTVHGRGNIEITPVVETSQLLGAKYGESIKIFARNEFTRPQQIYFIK